MDDGVSIAVSAPDVIWRHGFESRTSTKTIFKDIHGIMKSPYK